MKKNTTTTTAPDVWGTEPQDAAYQDLMTPPEAVTQAQPEGAAIDQARRLALAFDLEGLMTDFPTARDLERFVYDETGVVLNLKGRANRVKYQTALDVLNGIAVPEEFIGRDNPYIDRTEMVPQEDLRDAPPRDPELPDLSEVASSFVARTVPHPIESERMAGKRVRVLFRKYQTGEISYEVRGPLELRPHGEKLDKYGRVRPEIMRWIDPRSGEQLAQRRDGSLTPVGRRLKGYMQTLRVNNSNQWAVWVDRDTTVRDSSVISNPWSD